MSSKKSGGSKKGKRAAAKRSTKKVEVPPQPDAAAAADISDEEALKLAMGRKGRYINPGYLIVGSVQLRGCTTYRTSDRAEKTRGDELIGDWETHKRVSSITEHRAVLNEHRRILGRVEKLGTSVAGMGVIVPLARGQEMELTLREVDAEIAAYNEGAKHTSLAANFIVFEVSQSNDRVAYALYRKVAGMLDDINAAVESGSIKNLREVLRRAKGIDVVLPEGVGQAVSAVLEQAREAAKAAVKAAKKLDEAAATATIKEILGGVPIDAVRAGVIETVETIGKAVSDQSYLAPVDARQIE